MEHLFAGFLLFPVHCCLFFPSQGALTIEKRIVFAVKIKTKIDFSIKSIKESPLAKRIGINSAY